MKAYIIAAPGLSDKNALEFALGTTAKTPVMAWRRHIGAETDIGKSWDNQELSRRVQHWFDRGYRLRQIEINLIDSQNTA